MKYKVNLLTCDRYSAAEVDPVAKPVKVETNLPKTKSISGSRVPAAMAAMNACWLITGWSGRME